MTKLQIDAQIEALQKKKEWIELGMTQAVEAGYDQDDFRLERAVTKAYDQASSAHGYSMGDAYKPFDPDFNYPASAESLKGLVLQECRRGEVERTYDLVGTLKMIDPAFEGSGTLKEIFDVVSQNIRSDEPIVIAALRSLQMQGHKKPALKEVANYISASLLLRAA